MRVHIEAHNRGNTTASGYEGGTWQVVIHLEVFRRS